MELSFPDLEAKVLSVGLLMFHWNFSLKKKKKGRLQFSWPEMVIQPSETKVEQGIIFFPEDT